MARILMNNSIYAKNYRDAERTVRRNIMGNENESLSCLKAEQHTVFYTVFLCDRCQYEKEYSYRNFIATLRDPVIFKMCKKPIILHFANLILGKRPKETDIKISSLLISGEIFLNRTSLNVEYLPYFMKNDDSNYCLLEGSICPSCKIGRLHEDKSSISIVSID